MDLLTAHVRIWQQLQALRLERGVPAFLIEHGCTPDEIDELARAVGEGLSMHGLDDELFWVERHLPLLAVATEVGYRFGEERRVFWPRFEARVGPHFADRPRRERLIRLFRRLEPEPPSTEWVTHRRLIAYPVTHSVLPAWLHEPLLACLQLCPYRIEPGGSYFSWLMENAPRWPRLQILIHAAREPLARAVIEGILETGMSAAMRAETIARFRRDILGSPRSRALLFKTKARQPRLSPAGRAVTKGPSSTLRRLPRTVPLALFTDPLRLGLSPPALPLQITEMMDRIRVCPLVEQRPISLSTLLREGATLTRLPAVNDEEDSLEILSPRWLEGLDLLTRKALQSLTARVKPPLLFSDSRGPAGVALQVDHFSPAHKLWILTESLPPPIVSIQRLGSLVGLHCAAVEPSSAEAVQWLKDQGFSLVQSPALRLIGSPALDGPAGWTFSPEDVLALEVCQGPVIVGEEHLSDGLYRLRGEGDHRVQSPDGASVLLTVHLEDRRELKPVVELEICGLDRSVESLRERRLSLRLRGSTPITGLRVTLQLELDGVIVGRATTQPLPSLPCTVSSNDPVWERVAERLPVGHPVMLRASVGGLGRASWWLEVATTAVSWLGQQAETDEELHGYLFFDAATPLEPTSSPGDIFLKVPLFENAAVRPGTGICISPQRTGLHAAAPAEPRRTPRSWTGIEPLFGALQLWMTARSEHLIAEVHRRAIAQHLDRWSARMLCGEAWLDAEDRLGNTSRAFGEIVAETLRRDEIAAYAPAEEGWDDEKRAAFQAILASTLERAEPWLRTLVEQELETGPLVPLIDGAYRAVGVAEDPDLACEDELTRKSLKHGLSIWDQQRDKHALLYWVLPQSARAALAALPYAEATDEELVVGLTDWLKRAYLVAPWPMEQVKNLLGIWLWPTQVSLSPQLFERALVDQQGARAIRYAALRRREAGA